MNSIQAYWTRQFRASGRTYAISRTVFFDGSTPTGCGTATSDVGPFYCPADKHVYIDLGFFDELRRASARRAARSRRRTCSRTSTATTSRTCSASSAAARAEPGATGRSVRTELQADCLAGVWANHAAQTGYLTP